MVNMVYLFLAQGFEEVEALSPVDVLRRGGVDVVTVGVGSKQITGSHKITVTADITTDELKGFDGAEAVILPGGMPGTLNLEADEKVISAVQYCASKGLIIGAICAAPSILGHLGLTKGRRATAFPGFETELEGALPCEDGFVERDGTIITAKGMGVATDFGLELLSALKGEAAAAKVKGAIQCRA